MTRFFAATARRTALAALLAGGLVGGLATSGALAQEPGDVVAKVGDTEVTEADIAFASQDFADQLSQVPPTQWRKILTDVVVDMNVLANAAREAGIQDEEAFKRQVEFLTMRALRNAYLAREIEGKITDQAVQEAYDKEFANFEGEDERKARHILMKTKEEAEAVIAELDGGADFAEVAKAKSTGPSGPNGGDLGFFTRGRMVKEFEDAAFALEVGAYTKEPVETQFGWHVIKVEEARKQPAPALADVRDQLRQQLLRARYAEVLADLKAKTSIEVMVEETPAEAGEAPAEGGEAPAEAPKAE
ncbi:peptidylprolyl isomerase [Stappia indica]|uniref:Parvulin-like PPIase n=1 Tax=Stappia indica TaxID=538381 RepID=A0A857C7N6_9HYPH|nr:peptidylprolyl isomerase [Stappia indica]QGZ34994.1 peptidylprolyl isomerase [Stappia indica]